MSAEGKAVGKAAEGVIGKAVAEAGVREAAQVAAREGGQQAGRAAAEAGARNLDKSLLRELEQQGVKHSAGDVVRIARGADGKIVFLEKGNARAGLEHITKEHADDFARKGVPEKDIPDLVMDAVRGNNVVGHQGTKEPRRVIYRTEYNGETIDVAVSVGRNGFVVGANPR